MKRLLFALVFTLVASSAFAQVATPVSKLTWDQAGQDLATVQAYTYRHYDDGGTPGVVFPLVSITVVGTSSPFTVSALFPAFTPGQHTVTVSASNVAGESGKSNSLAFNFVIQPVAPSNLRLAFFVHPDGSITDVQQLTE